MFVLHTGKRNKWPLLVLVILLVSVDSQHLFDLWELKLILRSKTMTIFWRPNLEVNVEWLNKRGVKTQTALIPFGNYAVFSYSWSDVWLFLFWPIFPPLLAKRASCIEFSLLTLCTTRVKISRVCCESDEYFSLTVTTMWHGRRITKQTTSAPAPQLPPKKNMFNVLSSWKLDFSGTHWHFSVEWSNYSVKDI